MAQKYFHNLSLDSCLLTEGEKSPPAHRLPRRSIPFTPAHHTEGAISQLLQEAQVLLPDEAGEALQGPLSCQAPWGG